MEQLTKNQAVATSQEAVQNQNEPQLRDENAHNDKSVHGVLNPTYQAGLRRDAVQPDIEAERKKRDEINIRRRITIPLTLSNLKLLRRITRTENILHRNFTRRQVAIQNRVASNIGISQST